MKIKYKKAIIFSLITLFLVATANFLKQKYFLDNAFLLVPLSATIALFIFTFFIEKDPFYFLTINQNKKKQAKLKKENLSYFIAGLVFAFIIAYGFFEEGRTIISLDFALWLLFSALGSYLTYRLIINISQRQKKWTLFGLYLVVGAFLAAIIVSSFFEKEIAAEMNLEALLTIIVNLIYYFLFFSLLQLLSSEGAFRGYLFKILRKKPMSAAILSGIVFALWNLLSLSKFHWLNAALTIILGLSLGVVFSFLFYKSKSIFAPVVASGATMGLSSLILGSEFVTPNLVMLRNFILLDDFVFRLTLTILFLLSALYLIYRLYLIEKRIEA